jgi:hypothetical protein
MSVEIIKDDHNEYDHFKLEIGKFKEAYVKVGILEGSEPHKGKNGSPDAPMVLIGFVHEIGMDIKIPEDGKMRGKLHRLGIHVKKETDTIHIPERSFLRSWAEENKGQVEIKIEELMEEVAVGNLSAKKALNQLGAFAEAGIKDKFRHNDWEPLKFRSGTPLIDHGDLRNGIHHEVIGIK